MSLSRDFRLLENAFMTALLGVDPDRDLVFKAADVINELRSKKK